MCDVSLVFGLALTSCRDSAITSPPTNSISSGHFLGRTPLFRLAGHVRHGCFARGERNFQAPQSLGRRILPGPSPSVPFRFVPDGTIGAAESTDRVSAVSRSRASSADDGARDAIGRLAAAAAERDEAELAPRVLCITTQREKLGRRAERAEKILAFGHFRTAVTPLFPKSGQGDRTPVSLGRTKNY